MIAAASDSTVHVWDMPTGALVDLFKVDTPVLSFAFSPEGSRLATSHVGSNVIQMWWVFVSL